MIKIPVQSRLKQALSGILLVFFMAGCAAGPKTAGPEQEAPPPAETREKKKQGVKEPRPTGPVPHFDHVVQWEGETLSIIAKWYTGDLKNWTALAEANPDMDPNRIHIGDSIRIPAELLKTRERLPKAFVAEHTPKVKAVPEKDEEKKPSEEKEEKEKSPPLFGPKNYSKP